MSAKSVETELNHDVKMFKKYKNLLSELTRKNVKLKYRNSWLGIFWSFLQPLLNMIVLSVVFGSIFGRHNKYIVCYPVWLFSGRLLYEFFNTSTTQAMTSFRRNAAIIKKVYVPKYMYPLSSVLSSFVNFAISMICYVCVWVFFKITGISGGSGLDVTWHFLMAIVPMFLLLVLSTGIGLILSVLAVYFRDVEYIYQVLIRLMMYLLPIIYPMQKIQENQWLTFVVKINPLYSMIELFRQCVLYGQLMSWKMLLYAFVTSTFVLVLGMLVFNWKSDDIIYHL